MTEGKIRDWLKFVKEREPESLGEIKEISDPDLEKVIDLLFFEHPEILEHIIMDIGDLKKDVSLENRPALFGPEEKRNYQPRIALNSIIENEEKLLVWLNSQRPDKV